MLTRSLRIGAPLVAVLALSGPIGTAEAEPQAPTEAEAPFEVGAARVDITPEGIVNQGGFGLGDGSFFPDEVVGRGNQGRAESERLYARALVVDNGSDTLALVITENIGMFAKYQEGPGLLDIAESVEERTDGAIESEHVIAAGNHSHSGPDTLGAWGGVTTDYLQRIHDGAVEAVVTAYGSRRPAELVVGTADGRRTFSGSEGTYDLIDNQVCLETAANSFEGSSNFCAPNQESVDHLVRVLQAREVLPPSTGAQNSAKGCEGPGDHDGRTCGGTGDVIATFITYAAHPTLGGAGGLHGDWPEFVAAAAEGRYGGVAVAWPGAIGRVQPERGWSNRKADFSGNLLTLTDEALGSSAPVEGTSVDVEKTLIRSEVTNPALAGLLLEGEAVGAPLMRSREEPWLVGNVVQTVVSAGRIGDVGFLGVPGEAYPQIALEAADSMQGEATLFTLGLADDMLGYLISHTEDYPVIAGLTPVNDNALFNITPSIGDHVMCSGLRMADAVGFDPGLNPHCPPFDALDLATASDL